MIQIGKLNKLKILRNTPYGLFLGSEDGEEVLLPKRFVPDNSEIGSELEVFIHSDSEDRMVASLEMPYATVGQFAKLRVKSIERIGAFLDWGLSKDLFLPNMEQAGELRVGDTVVVYLYLDRADRIAASMRLNRYLSKDKPELEKGAKVEALIISVTDLGYKAIVNNQFSGLLFKNEVFRRLELGLKVEAYVKEVRADNKIDLSLDAAPGYKQQDDLGEAILSLLKRKGGYLAITDKTDPEVIYSLFGVSKKKFKIGLGGLYKKRLIAISDDGIRLI